MDALLICDASGISLRLV